MNYKKSISVLFIILLIGVAFVINKNFKNAGVTEFWDKANTTNKDLIDHSQWQSILDDYLISDHPSGINRLDYEGLSDELDTLKDYIDSMASLDPRDYSKTEQMAYWINLYNALTAKLIVENYPTASITELGETTIAFGPWDDDAIVIAGKTLSLNHIEHQILRPIWQDNRVHFAVNCASIGCPNLQGQAFTSENLDALLNKGAKDYMAHPRGIHFVGDVLVVSSLFDWYSDDFGNSPKEVLNELKQYMPQEIADKIAAHQGSIRYDYDWSLNDDVE